MDGRTVVLDGEMELILCADGDCDLSLPEYGEMGVITVVRDIDTEVYEGPYTVTPTFADQMLETEHKYMTDNVTVYEIPVTRTSNPQGGQTVLIG